MGHSDHRPGYNHIRLDSCALAKRFPFVYEPDIMSNGRVTRKLFPSKVSANEHTKLATLRPKSVKLPTANSQDLRLGAWPFEVEVDNSISPVGSCRDVSSLRVVHILAEGGSRWLEFADLLRDSDVVILEEMNVGVESSDQQQHTAFLRTCLWGLAYVVTPLNRNNFTAAQNRRDDAASRGRIANGAHRMQSDHVIPDFLGLHGHAILSRCSIHNKCNSIPRPRHWSWRADGICEHP